MFVQTGHCELKYVGNVVQLNEGLSKLHSFPDLMNHSNFEVWSAVTAFSLEEI